MEDINKLKIIEQPFVVGYLDGRILTCNKAFSDLMGYTEEELKDYRWIKDLTSEEWSGKDQTCLDELMKTGLPQVAFCELVRKDGKRIQVEVYQQLIRDRSGQEYFHAFVTDVTNRKQSGKALWEKQRAHFTLMGHLPGIAYRCLNDRNWTMKWLVGGCYELTGYHASDLIDNKKISWGKLIHPEDRERVWDVAQVKIDKHEPFQQEYRIITADGTIKWVWEQNRSGVNYKGEKFLEGFITDVTERKQAEEQLKTSLKKFKALMKEIYALDMKVITNLLNLQASCMNNEKKTRVFEEIKGCIEAVLNVQARLLQSGEAVEIDFEGFEGLGRDVEFIYDGQEYIYLR